MPWASPSGHSRDSSRGALSISVIAVGVVLALGVTQVIASASLNTVNSPIAASLLDAAIGRLQGKPTTSMALRDECTQGADFDTGRVLVNDATISGKGAAELARELHYGGSCRVDVGSGSASRPLSVAISTTFQDYWGLFETSQTRMRAWYLPNGESKSVPTMTTSRVVSIGAFHGGNVAALPFRDKRYALILFTKPDANVWNDRAYFSTPAFRAKMIFTPVLLTFHLPRTRLNQLRNGCEISCAGINATTAFSFSLDESGAGSAPVLPRVIGKLMLPGSGVVYSNGPVSGSKEIAFNHPFYLAVINLDSQRVLLDAIVGDPTP
jgi:hypothetical protein